MKISIEERQKGELTEASLAQALRTLRECGYVVLEAVLPTDWIETMRLHFEEQAQLQFNGDWPTGHGGVSVPVKMPFLDPQIIDNPFAMQILSAAMGEQIFAYLPYGNNIAWPGCRTQHIHRDTSHLFPETPLVLPMTLAVVNIPLVDFTEENGATEVWPGSHLIVDLEASDRAQLEERAAQLPSIQMVMPAGSVVVRDMRTWHRGMPNHTETIRTMLALVYFRRFHHLPDDPRTFRRTIAPEIWTSLSDRTRSIYRYNEELAD